MRNLIILGCAALLALGLSFGSIAGSITDADGDGVPDNYDNCVSEPNGPLASSGLCSGQEDAELDGYGNPCDYDKNQNGAADLGDLSEQIDNSLASSTNPVYDNDCNGAADLGDLSNQLDNSLGSVVVGPSGLACAGTIPCVAE